MSFNVKLTNMQRFLTSHPIRKYSLMAFYNIFKMVYAIPTVDRYVLKKVCKHGCVKLFLNSE